MVTSLWTRFLAHSVDTTVVKLRLSTCTTDQSSAIVQLLYLPAVNRTGAFLVLNRIERSESPITAERWRRWLNLNREDGCGLAMHLPSNSSSSSSRSSCVGSESLAVALCARAAWPLAVPGTDRQACNCRLKQRLDWMNEYLMEKNHRTRRAIRPLTLALIQQNIYKGLVIEHIQWLKRKKTFNSSMQLTYIYKISS